MRRLYAGLTPFYDLAVLPFEALGHRRIAVQSLALQPGDFVVDLGCGTGLNLAALHRAVGSQGRIIGVDLTEEMLGKAEARIDRAGLWNVELVQADVTTYEIPAGIDGVIATYVLEAVPEYDAVVRSVAAALPVGGRLVSYGLKRPDRWPERVYVVGGTGSDSIPTAILIAALLAPLAQAQETIARGDSFIPADRMAAQFEAAVKGHLNSGCNTMRKRLTILNAMVRDGREWDPSMPLDQLRIQHSC